MIATIIVIVVLFILASFWAKNKAKKRRQGTLTGAAPVIIMDKDGKMKIHHSVDGVVDPKGYDTSEEYEKAYPLEKL